LNVLKKQDLVRGGRGALQLVDVQALHRYSERDPE
jgi:hypothetical protein